MLELWIYNMKSVTEIIEARINNAEKMLTKYKNVKVDKIDVDLDTASALSILESKKDEIKNMLSRLDYFDHHDELIKFLKVDNPNMDLKVINRYVLWNYKILTFNVLRILSMMIIFIGIPSLVDFIIYAIFHNSPDVFGHVVWSTIITYSIIMLTLIMVDMR